MLNKFIFPGVGDAVAITFNPPAGVVFKAMEQNEKINQIAESDPRREEGRATFEICIDKDEKGFRYTSKTLEFNILRNGQPADDPLLAAFKKLTIVHEMDAAGEILKVSGYDSLVAEIKKNLPPNKAFPLLAIFGEEAMNRKEMHDWREKVTNFAGYKGKTGDVIITQDAIKLPTGNSAYYFTAYKLSGWKELFGKKMVFLEFKSNSDVNELADFVGRSADDILARSVVPPERPALSDLRISSSGERVFDPASMLFYQEFLERRTEYLVDFPGKGSVTTVSTEKKKVDYKYPEG